MILDNAGRKITYFNKIGVHYEAVYNYVIRNRNKSDEIFSPQIIDDITAGLISFDMQRMMGKQKYLIYGSESWASRLFKILYKHKKLLNTFKNLMLQDFDFINEDTTKQIEYIFNKLADNGSGDLNIGSLSIKGFPVGASKILHFLFPDLFIIVDSNARSELAKYHKYSKSKKINGKLYVEAMKLYQKELIAWAEKNNDPDFSKLLELDPSLKHHYGERTTPLPRIIDKCTFVGDKTFKTNQYLPLEFKSFIGGYFGTSYKVELFGDTIIHTVYDTGDQFKKSKVIHPSKQHWQAFENEIREIGVWEWKPEYFNQSVMDGTTWSVHIQYEDRGIYSRGNNQFPGPKGSSADHVTSAFESFLNSVCALAGGLPIK